ncbi:uncharacterized protein LOC133545187 [Nerophis ophidion]|uniref:uncharacterized protein LOC133540152 n=1 Tax=Nerophis ophidion TaxID=159077 RepID=UPI002AE0186F|nr:uncharacterized protein LOC133540152 [Nerophis ophidion]XP_061746541.1 uncharacterized protein LOC133545178 [Nerophis ophidion]XP_061746547.1 uncharacterized protein LOC133545187 [Nerophis ophidion]
MRTCLRQHFQQEEGLEVTSYLSGKSLDTPAIWSPHQRSISLRRPCILPINQWPHQPSLITLWRLYTPPIPTPLAHHQMSTPMVLHPAYTIACYLNPPENKKAAFLAPDRRDAGNPSIEDTICYQPQAEKSWTPCDGCREELEKMWAEKEGIEEVLLKIDPVQVRVLQTLCDLVGDKYSDGPPQQSGQQELFPESGVFISLFRLAAMRHAAEPKCMPLFGPLFSTVEECQNAVPF